METIEEILADMRQCPAREKKIPCFKSTCNGFNCIDVREFADRIEKAFYREVKKRKGDAKWATRR